MTMKESSYGHGKKIVCGEKKKRNGEDKEYGNKMNDDGNRHYMQYKPQNMLLKWLENSRIYFLVRVLLETK